MTTDITELAQSLKRRAASANEFGESLYVKADDILALVEALEKSDSRLHEVAVACATAEQALEKAQETIAFQQGEVKALLSSLESRTVKMPEPFKLAKSSSGLTYYFADDVDAALTAAGIKVEAE